VVIIIVIIIVIAPAHALLTVSHHLSICSTAACAANRCRTFKSVQPNQSKRSPRRGHARAARKESSIDCDLYRDCCSNLMAAILSQRCQPLVTRIIDI
jgi:hypothetical protein